MNRDIILLVIWLLAITACRGKESVADSTATYSYLGERTYEREDSIAIVSILDTLNTRGALGEHSGSTHIGRYFLDIPYVGHTLEINDEEKLVINTRGLDCTTFVETVVALRLCDREGRYGFDDYCDMLQKIRYGESDTVAYWNRNHYFVGWLAENEKKGYVERITDSLYHTAKIDAEINFMSGHVESYKMLNAHREWVPKIEDMERRVTDLHYPFIPKDRVENSETLRELIHDGDILALTTEIPGLDTQHIGFAHWREDGLHLMNASLLHKRVVIEEKLLYDYLQGQKKMTGVIVARIR